MSKTTGFVRVLPCPFELERGDIRHETIHDNDDLPGDKSIHMRMKTKSRILVVIQRTKKLENQSINQSINRPINQSTNQSINQSINRPTYKTSNQAITANTLICLPWATLVCPYRAAMRSSTIMLLMTTIRIHGVANVRSTAVPLVVRIRAQKITAVKILHSLCGLFLHCCTEWRLSICIQSTLIFLYRQEKNQF